MSLNWNVAKVKNFETVCYIMKDDHTKDFHPITNVLIWLTIMVDLGSITSKNISEWTWRITFLRRWNNYTSFVWFEKNALNINWKEKFSPFEITVRDLEKHIGLSTNVANLSRASWLKKMMKYFVRETRVEDDEVWVESLERVEIREKLLFDKK